MSAINKISVHVKFSTDSGYQSDQKFESRKASDTVQAIEPVNVLKAGFAELSRLLILSGEGDTLNDLVQHAKEYVEKSQNEKRAKH